MSKTSTNTNESKSINNDYNDKAMTKMLNTNIDCKLLKECSIMDLNEFEIREQLGPEVSKAVDEHISII